MQIEAPDERAALTDDLSGRISACTPAASLAAKLGLWAQRRFAGALKPLGLKPRHLSTLVALRAGPLTQQALGDAVEVDAAQLVGLLNCLEADALVIRRRDPGDRRRHIVEISNPGRELLAEADRRMAAIDDRMMSGLSPDDRARFVEMLRFVNEHGGVDESCAGKVEPFDNGGDFIGGGECESEGECDGS